MILKMLHKFMYYHNSIMTSLRSERPQFNQNLNNQIYRFLIRLLVKIWKHLTIMHFRWWEKKGRCCPSSYSSTCIFFLIERVWRVGCTVIFCKCFWCLIIWWSTILVIDFLAEKLRKLLEELSNIFLRV